MNVVELCRKRAINVRMYFELIIDVVAWLLVWLLLNLAELNSRGVVFIGEMLPKFL